VTKCQNYPEARADVAQPVEQRFRKLPVPIRPALTKNQAKRRIDGRQAPKPSPRTPVHLLAYAARRRGFFWLSAVIASWQSQPPVRNQSASACCRLETMTRSRPLVLVDV